MEANIKLEKKNFFKRRFSEEDEISGEVKLSNGKEFNIYFVLHKDIIEITSKNNEELQQDERIAIIEKILEQYTLLLNSILHFTISYCLEDFVLVDSTKYSNNLDEINTLKEKTILEEYLESTYSKISTNKLFRVLRVFYDTVKDNKSKKIIVPIEYKLNFEQRNDLSYFIDKIQRNIFKHKRYDVEIDKESQQIILTLLD